MNSTKNETINKASMKKEFENIFIEYCNATSLHGYAYLYSSGSIVIKIFWLIAIVSFAFISVALFVINTNQFVHSGIVTTIETSTGSLDVINIFLLHLAE